MSKSQKISFFPKFGDELRKQVLDDDSISIDFSYDLGIENKVLVYRDDNDVITFDENDDWNCDDYNLNVSISIKLKKLCTLFGPNGIAPKNSTIGLCIEWYSAQSKIRKIIKSIDDINSNDDSKEFKFNFVLPKQTFSGKLMLNALLYLKKQADNVLEDEQILNNETGVLLGNIFKKIVCMTGDGSLFPIVVQQMPNWNGLWKLEINIDEPSTQQLSDAMKLYINSLNKDYCYVDPGNKLYCEPFIKEIVVNALTLFFTKLIQSPEFDKNDLNYVSDDGSVLSYAKYCKNVMEIDFSDILSISKSLHNFIERGE